RVVAPDLIAALHRHERATFPNSDQPSVHAIKHILLDLTDQLARAERILAEAESAGRISPAAREWQTYIAALVAAAGGADGMAARGAPAAPPPCRREFQARREARRDERFTVPGSADGPAVPEEDHERHTEREFE